MYWDIDVGVFVSDIKKIKQVLMNLTTNAFKFTDKGEIKIVIQRNKVGREIVDFKPVDGRWHKHCLSKLY